ncbi:hypothetical protein V054_02582 [Staphylococcus aureus MSSA-47]|uniref:hypothetical protein n=1 Tax=Staphylococcus aureus TaxID=1280 RepID=UPI000451E2FD|nr:hypothetical protein [Staphylococcus aureus]EZT42313.1 hypothetical protein V054_02582 [Staphylococcus aureus MSSA-47]EZY39786.1 hypothetical protein V055_01760 [Staphylococcus aureus MRSA-118]EZY44947.1 hypothetical protein V057_01153 [Staphylococcus aureus MRSA-136]HDE8650638.1 hypothetical protein [Staphylococcus aureus]HDE8874435.1 hypothetical protein [Staphylococcus aureus]
MTVIIPFLLFIIGIFISNKLFNYRYKNAEQQALDEHNTQIKRITAWRKELEIQKRQEKIDIVIEALKQYDERKKQNETL